MNDISNNYDDDSEDLFDIVDSDDESNDGDDIIESDESDDIAINEGRPKDMDELPLPQASSTTASVKDKTSKKVKSLKSQKKILKKSKK